MTSSLVGSEMCIRDSRWNAKASLLVIPVCLGDGAVVDGEGIFKLFPFRCCLLYTSDAADDM
eukprot:10956528-Prorocentrum_lima.AAC.1